MRREWTTRSLVVLIAAAILTACSGGGGTDSSGDEGGEPQRGGTLTYAFSADAASIDPARCGVNPAPTPCFAIYGALTIYNPDTREFEPGIAESFETEDGLVWTLKLRPDVKFSDGTPFDAEAVVYNWERVKDPALLSTALGLAATLTWEVIDPLTVKITSSNVNYQLRWALAEDLAFIGSPTAMESKGADFATSPVGAGPFLMTSWAQGTEMLLERNDDYWDSPRPYVDKLALKVVPAEDQKWNALQSNQLNLAVMGEQRFTERAEAAGFSMVRHPHLHGNGLFISQTNGALADADVRTAVNELLDIEQIMEAFYPEETPATNYSPEGSPLYDPSQTFPVQDVDDAQSLIDGYLERTGEDEVTVKLTASSASPVGLQQAEMVQSQLQRAEGLNVEIVQLDTSALINSILTRDFELILSGQPGINTDNLYPLFHSTGTRNYVNFSDPEVDKALEMTRTTPDQAVADEAYKEVLKTVAEKGIWRFWRYTSYDYLYSDEVHDVRPVWGYGFRSDLVWISQ